MYRILNKIISSFFAFTALSQASNCDLTDSLEQNLNNPVVVTPANVLAIQLNNLPHDVQQCIFSYLDVKDVINMSYTSKYFKVQLETNYIWQPQLRKLFGCEFSNIDTLLNYKKHYGKLIHNTMNTPTFDIICEINEDGGIDTILTDKNTLDNRYLEVSGNGISVVGKNSNNNDIYQNEFFTWNVLDRKKTYQSYDKSWSNIEISSLNYDGNILFGETKIEGTQGNKGFIYNRLTSKSKLLEVPDKYSSFEIHRISRDNNIVLGSGRINNTHDSSEAFIWYLDQNKIIVLDNLANNTSRYNSIPWNISIDNTIIVGTSLNQDEQSVAVMWKGPDYEITQLNLLNNGSRGNASALSSDGKIIIGDVSDGNNGNRTEAVVWNTVTKNMIVLDHSKNYPLDTYYSLAKGVSADGQTVIGSAYVHSGPTGNDIFFIWTQETGMSDANLLLKSLFPLNDFLKLEGSKILTVSGIDASGRVIVGHAKYNNKKFGYRAVLPKYLINSNIDIEACRF